MEIQAKKGDFVALFSFFFTSLYATAYLETIDKAIRDCFYTRTFLIVLFTMFVCESIVYDERLH